MKLQVGHDLACEHLGHGRLVWWQGVVVGVPYLVELAELGKAGRRVLLTHRLEQPP